jgi:hypothetical protein
MAAAHHQLMQRVERPDRHQQATYARLVGLLAKRHRSEEPPDSGGPKLLLTRLKEFRQEYPTGFCGERWQGNEHNARVRRARAGVAQQAQRALSRKALEQLAKTKRVKEVWALVVTLVSDSNLSPEKLQSTTRTDQLQRLGESVRDLLHGPDDYEKRFDGFLRHYEFVFDEAPDWQAATALSALVMPLEHVCVEPGTFRKQLKAFARRSALSTEPTGAAYVRCRAMARSIASALAAQGEVPEDLLEVHAFIRATA